MILENSLDDSSLASPATPLSIGNLKILFISYYVKNWVNMFVYVAVYV